MMSPKERIAKYFVRKPGGAPTQFICTLCNPDWESCSLELVKIYNAPKKAGYTWGIQHLNGKHSAEMWLANEEGASSKLLQQAVLSAKAIATYEWIDWIVGDNHELTFCEKARVRRHTNGNLKPISVKTLKDRMEKIVRYMQCELSRSLPKQFGISFDGWSEFGVHYLAIFAVGPGVQNEGKVLLGFSPFEDAGNLSAQEHIDYLMSQLGLYERKTSDVIFLVGDNCAVNCKISNDLKIPLLGCNSHRLNLAVQRFLGLSHNDGDAADQRTIEQVQRRFLLDKLSALMSKLKTIKGKAKLAKYTDFVALKANATRWNGNYRMVKRFNEFKADIERFLGDEAEGGALQNTIALAMPTALEQLDIKLLEKALNDFQSVSLELQKKDGAVTLLEVRVLFDCLIDTYGDAFMHYLSPTASIVNNPAFETAIVKLLRNEAPLNDSDKAQLSRFEVQNGNNEHNTATDGMEEEEELEVGVLAALKNHRKRQRENQLYIDMKLLPVTSNIVERFFSQVKLTLTYLRNSLLPSTLEIVMFLKLNAEFMTKMTVHMALTNGVSASTVDAILPGTVVL
jgi:hypothetical protein